MYVIRAMIRAGDVNLALSLRTEMMNLKRQTLHRVDGVIDMVDLACAWELCKQDRFTELEVFLRGTRRNLLDQFNIKT